MFKPARILKRTNKAIILEVGHNQSSIAQTQTDVGESGLALLHGDLFYMSICGVNR